MKNIKYHQNGVGYEYGADHTLTDNWNPDADYGNEYVISDEEYEKYLSDRDEEIKKALFDSCHTTRTTKYYSAFDVCRNLAGRFRLNRLGLNDGRNYGSGQTIDHIMKIIDEMANTGLLVITKGKDDLKLVRSINKTEQKHLKLAL